MKSLPLRLKVFLITIYIVTVFLIYIFIYSGHISIGDNNNIMRLMFFTILIAITESLPVVFKSMSLSTSFAMHLAVYILFGPFTASILIIVGFSLRVVKSNGVYKYILKDPWFVTAFNYCALVLPILLGNFFYLLLGGRHSVDIVSENIIQIAVFCTVVFLSNTILISILFSIKTGKGIIYCIGTNIRLCLLNVLIMAPFGIMIAIIFKQYSYKGVFLLLFPVVLARYTFSLYVQAKSQYIQTVDALMRAMEARDKYTEGHSQRVSDLSVKIAKELKYNDWKIEDLKIAALLHDVGKIGVDDSILNKPGKLNFDEYNIIKSHPDLGYNILKDVKNLEGITPIVRYHHERYDGTGYPDGKMGEELNMDVFIVQLADSIDAMATDRPYRKAMSKDQILEEVKTNCGTQFHPRVVEAYLNIIMKEKNSCVR